MTRDIYGAEFAEAAHGLLVNADKAAYDGVLNGHGPFSAALGLYDRKSGKFITVGKIGLNAVVKNSDPGAHGEDQAFTPENLKLLTETFKEWKAEGRDPVVVLGSSSQSCLACQSKEEKIARHLIELGLEPGDFVVVYGNSYQDVQRITGFNDLPYVADRIRSDMHPGTPSMIREGRKPLRSIPSAVAEYFRDADREITVIAKDSGQILAVGRDQRTEYDLISTSPIVAIRNAGAFQKASGSNLPFQLGDPNYTQPDRLSSATMYMNFEPGLQAQEVSKWAAINSLVTVSDRKIQARSSREIHNLSNRQFRHLGAQGYRPKPDSFVAHAAYWIKYKFGHETALTVFHDQGFVDTAHHKYAELQGIQYNGANADGIPELYKKLCEKRFTGIPLGYH